MSYTQQPLSSPDSDEFLPHYARSTTESRNKRNTPKHTSPNLGDKGHISPRRLCQDQEVYKTRSDKICEYIAKRYEDNGHVNNAFLSNVCYQPKPPANDRNLSTVRKVRHLPPATKAEVKDIHEKAMRINSPRTINHVPKIAWGSEEKVGRPKLENNGLKRVEPEYQMKYFTKEVVIKLISRLEEEEKENQLLYEDLQCKNDELSELRLECKRNNKANGELQERYQMLLLMNSDSSNRIRELESKIDRTKDISNQALTSQKNEAERKYEQLTKILKEHVTTIMLLKEKNSKLTERYDKLEKDKESTNNEICKITEMLQDKERKIKSLTDDSTRKSDLSEQCLALQKEIADLKKERTDAQRKIESLSNKEKGFFEKDKKRAGIEINELKRALQDKEKEIRSLNDKLRGNGDLSQQCLTLQKEKAILIKNKEDAQKQIKELRQTSQSMEREIESLTRSAKTEENEKKLKMDILSYRSAYDKMARENGDLSEQCSTLQREKANLIKDKENAQKQIKELNQSSQSMERKIESLTNELTSYRNSNENLLSIHDKEKGLFEKDKKKAGIEISDLKRALNDKEKKIESLNDELRRSTEHVTMLSNEVQRIQKSKEQAVSNSEKRLHKENTSLQSDYEKAILKNSDLTEKYLALKEEKANLIKDKEDAQIQVMELRQTSHSMEKKIESLTNELTSYRNSYEDLLSIHDKEKGRYEMDKKKAGIEINELKRALHNKEKEIGSINDELKRINDISKECANLHKDKKSTALLVEKLSKTVEDREAKIHSLEAEISRFEEQISRLSDEIKTLHSSKGRAVDEKMQELLKENYSLKTDLTKAKSKYEDLSKKCEHMLMENEDAAHNIRQLTKDVQDKDQEINFLNTELTRVEDTVQELKDQKRDGQNTEQKISKLSKAVRDKEDEIESLIDQLAQSEDKNDALEEKLRNVKEVGGGSVQERIQQLQEENASLKSALVQTSAESKDKVAALEEKFRNMKAGGGSMQERIQQLQKENTSLQSDLVQKSTEAKEEISDLLKQIAHLKKSAKPYPGEHRDTQRLNDESAFLRAKLDDVNRSLEKLRRDYDVVKKEKDHALNRLSAVAGEKLRDNNPGIADLSDENRPINLGEKFSQLYDDQWTDAIENLEEMKYTETDGIRYLIDILKRVFDECVRISEDEFSKLQELTGTTNLPSDQLKKLKDLRKATAVHSVNKVKPLVNKVMSTVFKNEKAACQTYIDRSIELCWLMSVQDPPVIIDFTAVRGTDIDDQKFRKFTKTGTKIDFLVWPVIRLHKNGPPLQKGVVQPI